jgi:hypothetical protein
MEMAVVGPPDRDRRGGQVEEDRRPCQRGVGARRDRGPVILANLDPEHKARTPLRGEDQIGPERHLLAAKIPGEPDTGVAAGEPPLLVELAIIGQVAFRHDTK